MGPPVYRAPWASALYYATSGLWLLCELRVMVRNSGGRGENLDRGSRVWVVGLIAVGLAAAVALARLGVGLVDGWGPVIAGVAVAVTGIFLRQWSVVTLGSFFTTAVEVQGDHHIVQAGPYAWLRHPSYTGALLTVVGLSLGLGSWLGCLVATLFALAALVQRILIEEQALSMRLGPAWTAFAAPRKRLVPLVW